MTTTPPSRRPALVCARCPLALATLATAACLATGAASALAQPADVTSTRTYIQANYALVRAAGSHLASSEAAPLSVVLREVRRECPNAAAGSPQNEDSTQLSDEVIGAMVIAAIRPDLRDVAAFVRVAGGLRWSSRALTRAIHSYATKLRTLSRLAPPNLCGDVRAWVAGGYRTLAPSTVRFDQRFLPAWVALGELPSLLKPYERPDERGALRRSDQIEVELTDGEARAVESWGKIMDALALNP
jgi:hypothetical protein